MEKWYDYQCAGNHYFAKSHLGVIIVFMALYAHLQSMSISDRHYYAFKSERNLEINSDICLELVIMKKTKYYFFYFNNMNMQEHKNMNII